MEIAADPPNHSRFLESSAVRPVASRPAAHSGWQTRCLQRGRTLDELPLTGTIVV